VKTFFNTGLFIISIVFVFSCSHPKDDKLQPTPVTAIPKTEKSVFISLAGELDFRRTFADIQFMDDEKEINRYVARQEKSNPQLMDPANETLRKRFEELGIVKDKDLLLQAFKKKTKADFQFDDESGKKINVQFKPGEWRDHKPKTIGPDSCQITFYPFQDLRYALLDIIPGGNREIVLVNEVYIMNGYNFELMIYEICLK